MRTIGRLLKTTSQRISRNPYHSVGAIFVMFLTFFIGGIFILISLGSNIALDYYRSQPQINAFFVEGITQKEIDALRKKLEDTGSIESIKFISKEEALEIYKKQQKDDPLLTEFVTAEILPPSFQISTKELEDQESIYNLLKEEKIIDEVIFQQEVVEKLSTFTTNTRTIGIGLMAFLLITSILITLIVISLNISLHKDEIETMRLVGATESYVRTPFILEGIFYGIAAAAFSTIFIWLTVFWLTPYLEKFLSDIPIFPIRQIIYLYLFAAEAAAGIILGFIGSAIATRKYLKV